MLIADGHFSVKVICSDYKLCLKFSIFLQVLDYFRCQILHCGVEWRVEIQRATLPEKAILQNVCRYISEV